MKYGNWNSDFSLDSDIYHCSLETLQTIVAKQDPYINYICLVGHQPTFYPSLTAKENLLFISKIYKIDENQIIKKIVNSLDIVGLSNSINLPVSVFSSGMCI